MPAPAIIHDLVRRFEDSRELYRSGKYNEAQLRVEFLNPFFKALGWDVDNERNYAPQYREVIVEDSLQIEDSAKAPDYAFCLAGQRKFFVEAKKPAVDIKYDIHPAFQLRRYGWNKHLPLSILTDFEEFAVYDCRNKPDPHDSAATARLMLLSFGEYVERWDELAGLFSPQAILSGAFDRYVVETKGKKGTTEVDDAFLKDIEGWRELLARNIALRNRASGLTERQLNYAVQMTIDRIIFLRICEDRSLEPEEKLLSLTHTSAIYPALLELFRHADEKYNSGLFHFSAEKGQTTSADSFTPGLQIDDKALKEIIRGMYYPCPYIFKEIPVEILGQVYEQFLGKVIRLTPGGQARVEEKPEVRKAGGVYYTPRYIVDYIVKNTVGKLLEGKTPAEASALSVVDPACGSGSFLLGAYQYLLDWHEQYYLEHDPESFARGKSPALVPMGAGVYRLSTAERKRILVNNIYGVDIDAQAVEVTKLSLLLKLLEQESGQLTLGFERVLPDLGRNIRCGNSLIGWDYFKGQLLPDQAEVERVNPFDWQREFPQVFAQGGFDAVIGNPPYVRTIGLENMKMYYRTLFESAYGGYDIYILFIEKGLQIIKLDGFLGVITPNKYFVADYGKALRKMLLRDSSISLIADMGKCKSVFSDALISTAISIIQKSKQTEYLTLLLLTDDNVKQINEITGNKVNLTQIINDRGLIQVYSDVRTNSLIEKIYSKSDIFSDVANVRTGIMGFDYWAMDDYVSDYNTGLRIATNSYIDRYKFLWGKKVNLFKREVYEPRLPEKCDVINENTWSLFKAKKIIIRGVAQRLTAMIDEEGIGLLVAVHSAIDKVYSPYFTLGLLNSQLFNWLHLIQFYSARIPEGSLRYPISFISNLPIIKLDLSSNKGNFYHNSMVSLVNTLLELKRRSTTTPLEEEQLHRAISATDAAIDRLVYELYGLTEEEIRIIEGST